ncbi:MAG: metallophosphoesterase [Acidobacteria bacterium]|nr:metallophosphoesterase [Acidobacteriota bacterium]
MVRPLRIRYLLVFPILLGALVLAASGRGAAAQSSGATPCDIRTTERIVAVGDVHGAYDRFVSVLRAAGLIDGRARWTGGRAVLVQTGDVLDRGADSRRVLDLLRRLERDAAGAGGRVYALLGNHEVMRMISDWRYVSPEEIAAFRTGGSEELRERVYAAIAAEAAKRAREEKRAHDEAAFRERFMSNVPLGLIEMQQAFGPSGDYGKWLRERYALVRINGIAFVHGGIDATTAALGCEGINEAVRRDITLPQPTPEQISRMLVTSETGPLWYRGLATEPEPAFAPQAAGILKMLEARAIVIGHTVTTSFRISLRFDGRVVQIDTGMLGGTWYPGGVASALEIRGDALTAIYEKGRERLPALAPAVP